MFIHLPRDHDLKHKCLCVLLMDLHHVSSKIGPQYS